MQASRYILGKAYALGRKMAFTERRICPDLSEAHQCSSYAYFRAVHRYRMESRPAFDPWLQKIEHLIEREGNSQNVRLNDTRCWERFYSEVADFIHSAFWCGWESVFHLEELYDNKMDEARRLRDKSCVLKVYTPEPLPQNMDSAENRESLWGRVASKLFDDPNADHDAAHWDFTPSDALRGIVKEPAPDAAPAGR